MTSSAPRAVACSLVLGAIFEGALFGSKETPAVYGHAPWLNDPYDTAVSFALFCIPLIIAPSALRLLADFQWPDRGVPERLTDLLRGCGIVLVVVGTTLAACWAAVAGGANHAAWRPVTAIQVVVLALFSVGAIACAASIWRAARALRPGTQALEAGAEATEPGSVLAPDWLGDMIGAGRLLARVCGPIGRPATRALDWADDRVVPLVRRHPIGAAAVLGGAAGLAVTVSQSVTEGYRPVIAAFFFLIASCGVFAFAVTVGSYLRVIRTKRPARARAPLIRATVLAAAAVPVALAFRAPLWSFVGADPRGSGLGALLLLLGSVALLAFGVGLAGERLTRASCVKQVPGQRARLR